MLLEFPNPKDPQDAEVAKMLVNEPERFAMMAHEWAVKYGGAPRGDVDLSKYRKDGAPPGMIVDEVARYDDPLNTTTWYTYMLMERTTDTRDTTRILSTDL